MMELLERSALHQAELIRRREISVRELSELYLTQIRERNPATNALVETYERRARAYAIGLDAELRVRGARPGPLFGVPTAIKDLDNVRFSRTRFGSRPFQWMWFTKDGVAARRVRAAGLVILGKTATSEMGLMPITDTPLHGPTRNPWNTDRTVGGSSGGAGAAVAARMLPLAHGSDGAGSIRIPAALNGVFGYKPSRDFLLDPTGGTDPFGLAVLGPLARTVEDLAALGDVWRVDRDGPSLLEGIARAPEGAVVAVMKDPPFGEVPADLLAAVDRAAAGLSNLGHRVREQPQIPAELDEFVPIYQHLFARMPLFLKHLLHPTTRWFIEQGRGTKREAMRRLANELSQRIDDAWGDAEFLLTPTVATKTPRIGAYDHLPPAEEFAAVAPLGVFTAAFNLGGQPAINIPMGIGDDAMPIGVQLVGRRGDDVRLVALAKALTDELGASAEAPPLVRRS